MNSSGARKSLVPVVDTNKKLARNIEVQDRELKIHKPTKQRTKLYPNRLAR